MASIYSYRILFCFNWFAIISAVEILLFDDDYFRRLRRLLLADDLLALGGVRVGDVWD